MKRLFFKKRSVQFEKPLPPLAACLLMDVLGCASYLLPVFGEVFDLIWAPISGVIYFRMFGGAKGLLGGTFSFIEELLSGLDIIPTFTITWFMLQRKREKNTITIYPSR